MKRCSKRSERITDCPWEAFPAAAFRPETKRGGMKSGFNLINRLGRIGRRLKGTKTAVTEKSSRAKGLRAEDIAAERLRNDGYHIIERNFSCKVGEIDIIARNGGELVFVEVRSRSSEADRDPIHSIDQRKRRKIARTAQYYLAGRYEQAPPCRFDVVIVTMGASPRVEIIPNAFDASDRDV